VTKAVAFNRTLGLRINREVRNERQFERYPICFAEDGEAWKRDRYPLPGLKVDAPGYAARA
jgi:hypothetical protein